MLGVPSPPPFADPSTIGSRIVNGVNYASASGGILDESGRLYVHYTHTCLNYCSTFYSCFPLVNNTEVINPSNRYGLMRSEVVLTIDSLMYFLNTFFY